MKKCHTRINKAAPRARNVFICFPFSVVVARQMRAWWDETGNMLDKLEGIDCWKRELSLLIRSQALMEAIIISGKRLEKLWNCFYDSKPFFRPDCWKYLIETVDNKCTSANKSSLCIIVVSISHLLVGACCYCAIIAAWFRAFMANHNFSVVYHSLGLGTSTPSTSPGTSVCIIGRNKFLSLSRWTRCLARIYSPIFRKHCHLLMRNSRLRCRRTIKMRRYSPEFILFALLSFYH